MRHRFAKKATRTATGIALAFGLATTAAAQEPFLGELRVVGFNFCPRGWALADGQLLPIASNTALFSLLGTAYGGDGRTTFALPDLRGRTPVHIGTGAGLTPRSWGQRFVAEQFTLTSPNQLPAHNHRVNAMKGDGDKRGPGNDYMARPALNGLKIYGDGPPDILMDQNMITNTGASAPVTHQSPALGMYHCIATQGIFPSRN